MNEDDYVMEAPPVPKAATAKKSKKTAASKPSDNGSDEGEGGIVDALIGAMNGGGGKKGKKAPNPRDGRAKKGKDGEAASFTPGDAAPPASFDAGEICAEMDLYWEADGGDTFVVKTGEVWSRWPVSSVKLRTRQIINQRMGRMIALSARKDSDEVISEMDTVLLHAREHRCVEKVLPALAGYRAGVRDLSDGRRVVVRMSPKIIEEAEGEWPTIRALIEDRLDLGAGDVNQSVYFHAWCKVAYESLKYGEPGSYKPGHALVLPGPVGSGKSRLQVNIITPLLGGRKADPTAFLTGDDSFNADMMGSEHLMMEELLTSSWSAADRVNLSEAIKRLVANESKRMRLMRTDPLTVDPFWRLSLSMNNDPDKMRAFPMLTPDFRDKVLMLLVQHKPLPMPTTTAAEQKAFNDQIRKELPAYAWWLLNGFTIPDGLLVDENGRSATRFGFTSYQHPSLIAALFDDTPAAQLLRHIDAADIMNRTDVEKKLWELKHPMNYSGHKARGGEWVNTPGVWAGSAELLEDLLCGELDGWTSSVARPAKRLIGKGSLVSMLQRLREDQPLRIDTWRRTEMRGWMISCPPPPEQAPGAPQA